MARSETFIDGLSLFFEERGISPAAGIGFALLLAVGAALLGYDFFSQPAFTQEVRALVLSSGSVVEGAAVEVFSQDGSLIASGVTGADGRVAFAQKLASTGRVTIKVSKRGFVSASGERVALAVIDLSRAGGKPASIELYSSQLEGGDFAGGISFIVLDKLSRQPVEGASLNVFFAGQSAVLAANEQGKATLQVPAGATVRVKISAAGYYSDSRSFTAIRPEETILVTPRSAQQVSFDDELPQIDAPAAVKNSETVLEDASHDGESFSMPQARLVVTDSEGNAVQSGTLSVVSSSGQEIASAPIANGVAGLSDLLVSQGYSMRVSTPSGALEGGSVQLFDAASNNLVLTRFLQQGSASLSPAPLATLGVSVRTASGQAVSGGVVKAHDSVTGVLLAQAQIFNGFASLQTGLQADSRVTLSLDSPGYAAQPVDAIFGRTVSLTLVAAPVSQGQLLSTTIRAFEFATQQPVSATVRVFRQLNAPPVAEASFSSSTSFQLDSTPGSSYTAVFSSPGYYAVSISAFPAGATVDAVLARQGSSATANECFTSAGRQSCVQQSFTPSDRFSLNILVQSQSGAVVGQALVSVKDSLARSVFAGRTGGDGRAIVSGLQSGKYKIAASAFGSSYESPSEILLSEDKQVPVLLELKGTLLLAAKAIDGSPVEATFSASTNPPLSCSGSSCSLRVPSSDNLIVTASAPGFRSATATRNVAPGQLVPMSFELVPDNEQLRVAFSGAEDSRGRPVSSLLAGQDYFLKFSIYSSAQAAQDETVFSLRLGGGQSVEREGFGILEFDASGFEHATKSISYSPQPTCVDVNNANSLEGMYKWMQLFFANKGAALHRIVSVPVRVRSNSPASMPVFYRLSGKSGSTILRTPLDPVLGSSENSASKAGCYARENRLELRVGLSNSCLDATGENECSDNSPLACERQLDGSLRLVASAGCCAASTRFENGECVSLQARPPGACVDGTDDGQCSQVNKPKACVGGQLVASSSCCRPGEQFDNGVCRPPAASCQIALFVFPDGACLPTQPGRCRDGVEVQDGRACGCPAGSQLSGSTCSGAAVTLTCSEGTAPDVCSQKKPLQCVSFGGRLALANNALQCGCAEGMISNGVECRERSLPVAEFPPEGCVCPLVFQPVCAANGRTYDNSCFAQCAGAQVSHQGACPGGVTPPPQQPPTPDGDQPSCPFPNSCLDKGNSDEYCTAKGTIGQSCLVCNRDCGGNLLLRCNPATNTCTPRTCSEPAPFGTPVEQCVEGKAPRRCAIDLFGNSVLLDDSARCGCAVGEKADANGEGCVACANGDCSDAPRVCRDADGAWHGADECLPEKFSKQTGLGVHLQSEPILKCNAGGEITAAIIECGCPLGFKRDGANRKCVAEVPPSQEQVGLPSEVTCPNCVERDTVFLDSSDGRLKTASGKTVYYMQADDVFPADAFVLDVDRSTLSSFRVSVQAIKSAAQSEGCYEYDLNTGKVLFRVRNGCPIEVRGNGFVHTGLDEPIAADKVKIILRLETVPPQDLELELNVNLASLNSFIAQPVELRGPDTPQLVFLVNQKQTIFGPRTLSIAAKSSQNNELPGAGVKVLAWRGPGSLSISEGDEQLASLSYSRSASYFACASDVLPTRIESCGGDAFCCTGGWCNRNAFGQMFSDFREYARNVAQQSAFRRGVDKQGAPQPFSLISSGKPFELYTAAGVVDGSQNTLVQNGVSLSGFDGCSDTSRPGVYSIRAGTSDGKKFSFKASVASLQKFDYVDGTCGDEKLFKSDASLARPDVKAQPLCNFLYGDCSCVKASKRGVLATNKQNKDENSLMDKLPLLAALAPLLDQFGKMMQCQGDPNWNRDKDMKDKMKQRNAQDAADDFVPPSAQPNPDGTIPVPPGTELPDGSTAPPGTVRNPDGSFTLPDDTMIQPGGMRILPDGTAVPPDKKPGHAQIGSWKQNVFVGIKKEDLNKPRVDINDLNNEANLVLLNAPGYLGTKPSKITEQQPLKQKAAGGASGAASTKPKQETVTEQERQKVIDFVKSLPKDSEVYPNFGFPISEKELDQLNLIKGDGGLIVSSVLVSSEGVEKPSVSLRQRNLGNLRPETVEASFWRPQLPNEVSSRELVDSYGGDFDKAEAAGKVVVTEPGRIRGYIVPLGNGLYALPDSVVKKLLSDAYWGPRIRGASARQSPLENTIHFQSAQPPASPSSPDKGCFALSEKYEDSRKKTDVACSPKDGKVEGRKGERDWWVDWDIADAKAHSETGSSLWREKWSHYFKLDEKAVKNDGGIVKALDECEDEEHSANEKESLEKFCEEKVRNAVDEAEKKAKAAIKMAYETCLKACEDDDGSRSSLFLNFCPQECQAYGEAPSAGSGSPPPAIPSRNAFRQLEERLGGVEDFSNGMKAIGGRRAKGQVSDTETFVRNEEPGGLPCTALLALELQDGGACELSNKVLPGKEGVGGLLVEEISGPLERWSAWHVCYAYGSKGGGKCESICQTKDSFVHVFEFTKQGGPQLVGMDRYGLDSACQPKAPRRSQEIHEMNANELADQLNKLGFAPTPTPAPAQPKPPATQVTRPPSTLPTQSAGKQVVVHYCDNCVKNSQDYVTRMNRFLTRLKSSGYSTSSQVADAPPNTLYALPVGGGQRISGAGEYKSVAFGYSPIAALMGENSARQLPQTVLSLEKVYSSFSVSFAGENPSQIVIRGCVECDASLQDFVRALPKSVIPTEDKQVAEANFPTARGLSPNTVFVDTPSLKIVNGDSGDALTASYKGKKFASLEALGGELGVPENAWLPQLGRAVPGTPSAASHSAPQGIKKPEQVGGFPHPFDGAGGSGVLGTFAGLSEENVFNAPLAEEEVPPKKQPGELRELSKQGAVATGGDAATGKPFEKAHEKASDGAANVEENPEQGPKPLTGPDPDTTTPEQGKTVASPKQKASAEEALAKAYPLSEPASSPPAQVDHSAASPATRQPPVREPVLSPPSARRNEEEAKDLAEKFGDVYGDAAKIKYYSSKLPWDDAEAYAEMAEYPPSRTDIMRTGEFSYDNSANNFITGLRNRKVFDGNTVRDPAQFISVDYNGNTKQYDVRLMNRESQYHGIISNGWVALSGPNAGKEGFSTEALNQIVGWRTQYPDLSLPSAVLVDRLPLNAMYQKVSRENLPRYAQKSQAPVYVRTGSGYYLKVE